ncbi:MAG: ImmA/IrrE family metallo-endopeptidase [Dehalococcoidia bacterium]
MRKAYCRSEAQRLLSDCTINAPPVDATAAAASLFLEVQVKRPWRWASRSLLRREDGQIWVNADESRRGQRFSIGHEIGHFLLHPDTSVFSEHADPETLDYAPDPQKTLEAEADYFSSVLLVPPKWFSADVLVGLQTRELVCRYDVSDEVVFIALQQRGLLSRLGKRSRR